MRNNYHIYNQIHQIYVCIYRYKKLSSICTACLTGTGKVSSFFEMFRRLLISSCLPFNGVESGNTLKFLGYDIVLSYTQPDS